MAQLTPRQQNILDFVGQKGEATNKEILSIIQNQGGMLSRETLVRELNALSKSDLLEKIGKGRGVKYRVKGAHPLLVPVDVDAYLSQDVDTRAPKPISFNFDIFSKLAGIFSDNEIAEVLGVNGEYHARVAKLSPVLLQKEFERITIELAWKSSKIEGNTYTLLDTEALIKEHREAEGHTAKEAVMILNHKKALDYILANRDKFQALSLRTIEDVHRLLVDGLEVNHGIRTRAVGITGTAYRPLDNKHQIVEVVEKAIAVINAEENAWSKAFLSLLLIAYIQPFEDGNKRTSRLLANACLLAAEVCPLSFRSIDETEYKKAVTLFYELNNASVMKKLFLEQWKFAVGNYFK
ncbi:MAG: Fic family protein [Parcubacteria group bacterium GW2011_GWA2_47_16]|nr:MAG: Fic family protein [Parcubacteria group bacterium GW2011_GWA2_47_16]